MAGPVLFPMRASPHRGQHLAFYAGWPAANTAVVIARQVLEDSE